MTRARHIAVIDLELRRAVKVGAAAANDWREMLAWARGDSPVGEYEWARWLDMAAGALVAWVNAWQASINAGRAPPPETLAKLEAHRDGLRALRSQLYLLSIANAREKVRALRERIIVMPAPTANMADCSTNFAAFMPPVAQQERLL